MDKVEEALKKSLIDVSNSGLRAYYLHPEDRSKYISFPVTKLGVRPRDGVPKTGLGMESISFDQGMSIQYRESKFFVWSEDEMLDFFSKYGLEDYIQDYYIGCFTETNDYAKSIMIPDFFSEWDGEETGEVQIFRWRGRDSIYAGPLAPFERYIDDPTYEEALKK